MSLKARGNKGNIKCSPVKNNQEPAPVLSNPEIEQQFETELCWCIQQLQAALKSGKLNQKQIQENTKSLNTLMNNSVPMVKKRQVMRLCFGDYRAKMKAEEDKYRTKNLKIKVLPAKPSKKSQFLRKSLFSTKTGDTFRFNFNVPDDITDDVSKITLSNESEHKVEPTVTTKTFHFLPSNNDFKFNFDVSSDD